MKKIKKYIESSLKLENAEENFTRFEKLYDRAIEVYQPSLQKIKKHLTSSSAVATSMIAMVIFSVALELGQISVITFLVLFLLSMTYLFFAFIFKKKIEEEINVFFTENKSVANLDSFNSQVFYLRRKKNYYQQMKNNLNIDIINLNKTITIEELEDCFKLETFLTKHTKEIEKLTNEIFKREGIEKKELLLIINEVKKQTEKCEHLVNT